MIHVLPDNPRALLTALHQAAVQGANPLVRTRDAVHEWLSSTALSKSSRVHVFALGKAAATMSAGAAQALRAYGISVVGGVVVPAAMPGANATPDEGGELPPTLEIRVGDHPVPDIGSLAAADVIARKVNDVQKDDVALVLISGGATSLCAAPCDELRERYDHALESHALLMNLVTTLHQRGLAIHEMNAIRRRLLRWGGGRLAVALADRGVSQIRVFSVSDVIGDEPSVIGSGPCSPDPMSESEFLAMLDAYNLREHIPGELAVAFGLQGSPDETILPPHPGDHAFSLVEYNIVARNQDSCQAMAMRAEDAGLRNITVVDVPITGEAETVGHTVATIAIRAAKSSNESQLIVWGGEPVVNMDEGRLLHDWEDDGNTEGPLPNTLNIAAPGAKPWVHMSDVDLHLNQDPEGGRMQALALAASLALEQAEFTRQSVDLSRIWVLAAGTDGRDGPTDACGAIVNARTPAATRANGRDPIRDLYRFRSYPALDAAGVLLRTGPTGTNVMDVVAVYIAPVASSE